MGLIDKFIEIKIGGEHTVVVLVLDKIKIDKKTRYICSENNGKIHIVSPEKNTILKLWEREDLLEEISKNNFIYSLAYMPQSLSNIIGTIIHTNIEVDNIEKAKENLDSDSRIAIDNRPLIIKYNPQTPDKYLIVSIFDGIKWNDVPEEEQK